MRQAQKKQAQVRRTRRMCISAFAAFALSLQSWAPLTILPPHGQAVHFAHAQHGGQSEHHQPAPRPETPSCPVCQALLSSGTSTPAAALVLSLVHFNFAAAPLPREIEEPAAPALPRARARAPPMDV
jgi:hypothetical protein